MSPALVAETVRTTTGAVTASGIWSLFGLVLLACVTIAGGVFKYWVPWKNAAAAARDNDFARLRAEIEVAKSEAREAVKEAREDARAAQRQAQDAQDRAMRVQRMLDCSQPAISLLIAEIERLDPNSANNAALVQARALMVMAVSGDMGAGAGLAKLVGGIE